MGLRSHFKNTENRKAELDPSTFDHPEQYQPHPTGLDWFVIAVWGGLFLFAGLAWWGIIAGVKAAWSALF